MKEGAQNQESLTNNTENIQDNHPLNETKSFEEHMAEKQNYERAYREAKSKGNLPEGVRDAIDYREYLEEHRARESEGAKDNSRAEMSEEQYTNAFVEAIKKINSKHYYKENNDFAISMFGNFKDEKGEVRSLALDKIVEYGQSDEDKSLLNFLKSEKEKNGYGNKYNDIDCRDEVNTPEEKMWHDINKLEWGRKVDLEDPLADEEYPLRGERIWIDTQGADSYYFDEIPTYPEPDHQEYYTYDTKEAVIRALIKDAISKYIIDERREEEIEKDYHNNLNEDCKIENIHITLGKMSKSDEKRLKLLKNIYDNGCDVGHCMLNIVEQTIGRDRNNQSEESNLMHDLNEYLDMKYAIDFLEESESEYLNGNSDGRDELYNYYE